MNATLENGSTMGGGVKKTATLHAMSAGMTEGAAIELPKINLKSFYNSNTIS